MLPAFLLSRQLCTRLTMLAPALMSGIRRAGSLVSPSVARCSASISQSDASGRFSPSLRRLHPTSSLATPSLFRFPRRLFGSQAPEHHSRRIYHPCIDGVFQYGFESPTAIINFLNAALDLKGQREIQTVEHIKRDMPAADPTSPLGYHFTVDVRCRTKDGHHFLVEMQNDFRDDYHLKALIEHSRMLSRLDTDQTEDDKEKRMLKNKDHATHFWKGIQGIYTVVITNKAFAQKRMNLSHPDETLMEPLLVNPYELRHTEQLDRHYGDMPHRIVLLMLDHLKKPAAELSSPIEDWAYVFKDTALKSGAKKIPETKEIEDIELVANRNPGIREFIERIDVKNLPAEVHDRYVRAIHYYNTTIVDIEEKGKAIGRKEGILQAACAMKEIGIPDEKIAEALGLNQQEMESLKRPGD
jgi:PD-(D/E)XK nuclease family transposase